MASDKHLARLMEGAAAWNRWRLAQPLVRPDLQGVSLTLAQKQWGQANGGPINFVQCMLRESDLRHATLIDADLSGADLIGADLSGARMHNANLRGANLSHVLFDGADLMNARLSGANLNGADLSGARNLSASQIDWAEGDARTLLPPQIIAPARWLNARDSGAGAPSDEFVSAAVRADATFAPSRRERDKPEPQLELSADRFAQLLSALPHPQSNAVASQTKRALPMQPRLRVDAVAERAKRALKSLLTRRFVATASGGAGLLLLLGLGGLMALRAYEIGAGTKAYLPSSAPPHAEAAQTAAKLTVARAVVRDISGRDQVAGAAAGVLARPSEITTGALPVAAPPLKPLSVAAVTGIEVGRSGSQALPVQDLTSHELQTESLPTQSLAIQSVNRVGDRVVRLAFAMRTEDGTKMPEKPVVALPLGAQTVVAKANASEAPGGPETAPEVPQAGRTPTSVVDYLSMPNKSSDWIKVFIKRFYLSGEALDDADLRRIYSHQVEYFGKHKTSLDEVAREKARYYRDWPQRHYELVPGSIDIAWKSAEVAEVSFTYRYKVSARNKRTAKGRGRAHLTLDLRGHTGLIVREDGKVIAHN